MGEEMLSTFASGRGSCNAGGIFVGFDIFGQATGPFTGRFEENGAISQSQQSVYQFRSNFTIFVRGLGQIFGNKYVNNISVTCNPVTLPTGGTGSQIMADFFTNYSATPNFFPSTCNWSGTAHVDLVFILDSNGNIIQSSFDESILTSNSCAPPVGPPAFVMVQPTIAFNNVGTSHTVTATVTDFNGNPVPGTTVFFSVTGADSTQGTCATDQNGMCSFTYLGPQLPGADDITGCAGGDYNAQPCGDATKIWTLPASTPGQVTGGGQIIMPPADKVSFGFNAQSDGTTTKGNCNVIDHDKRIHIKCDNVQVLVVAGTHATFFGQADQDGVTTNYRIDVDDLTDPGAGIDNFKIQIDQGYLAGGFLTAGNIQIHK